MNITDHNQVRPDVALSGSSSSRWTNQTVTHDDVEIVTDGAASSISSRAMTSPPVPVEEASEEPPADSGDEVEITGVVGESRARRSAVAPVRVKEENLYDGFIPCPHPACKKDKLGVWINAMGGCKKITCTNHWPQFFIFCIHCKKEVEGGDQDNCTCVNSCSRSTRLSEREKRNREHNRESALHPVELLSTDDEMEVRKADESNMKKNQSIKMKEDDRKMPAGDIARRDSVKQQDKTVAPRNRKTGGRKSPLNANHNNDYATAEFPDSEEALPEKVAPKQTRTSSGIHAKRKNLCNDLEPDIKLWKTMNQPQMEKEGKMDNPQRIIPAPLLTDGHWRDSWRDRMYTNCWSDIDKIPDSAVFLPDTMTLSMLSGRGAYLHDFLNRILEHAKYIAEADGKRENIVLHDVIAAASASGYTVPQWAREAPCTWGKITDTRFTALEFASRPWWLEDVTNDVLRAMIDHHARPLTSDESKMGALAILNILKNMSFNTEDMNNLQYGTHQFESASSTLSETMIYKKPFECIVQEFKEDVCRLDADISSGSSLFDNPSHSPMIPNGHKDFADLVVDWQMCIRHEFHVSRQAVDLLREFYDVIAFGHMSRSPAPLPNYMSCFNTIQTPSTDKEAICTFVSSTGIRVVLHHTFEPSKNDANNDDSDRDDNDSSFSISSSDTDSGDEMSLNGDYDLVYDDLIW